MECRVTLCLEHGVAHALKNSQQLQLPAQGRCCSVGGGGDPRAPPPPPLGSSWPVRATGEGKVIFRQGCGPGTDEGDPTLVQADSTN